jgi:nitrogen fixation/metabolism regulation signal transduction histidine kinase
MRLSEHDEERSKLMIRENAMMHEPEAHSSEYSGGLRRRIITWFMLVAFVPVVFVGVASYSSARNSLHVAAHDSLSTITNNRVTCWI